MQEKQDIEKFRRLIRQGYELLECDTNKDLFDRSYLYEFQETEKHLEENLKRSQEKGRKLTIGIVGAVKAGKSSFLNALLFKGEQVLPKAITPSTATLTKISYSETTKAIVHFFKKEDWNDIVENSEKYVDKLNVDYGIYCQKFDEQEKDGKKALKEHKKNVKLTIEEYDKKIFSKKYKDERIKSARELVQMTEGKHIFSELGTQREITDDVMNQLKEYVDARGKYTSIVDYVEIQTDAIPEGIEVIDTPGLYDPVISRGVKTKEFLSKCDVVFLLSSCSQFMPASTVELMINNLPNAGVEEIIVVGSKYDSGILNDKGGDFLTKTKKARDGYDRQFHRNMETIQKNGINNGLIAKIERAPRLYVSSICYCIDKKKKQGNSLDEEEKNVYRQLNEYANFTDKYLQAISGITEAQRELNEILERREEIIVSADEKIISTQARNFARILDEIRTYVESTNIKLRNISKEDIENQYQKIQDAIVLSRKQLSSLFEVTGLQCEKRLISTKSVLAQEMINYTSFKTTTETSEDVFTVDAGLFGWRKDTVKTTVTTRKASTAQVKMNLESYWARCVQIINDEFDNLFNKNQFTASIKEIIMKTYDSGSGEYSKEDIVLPVDKLLQQLVIPKVEVDVNPYIDELNSHFSKGFAVNDEIHTLDSTQAELLGKIRTEFEEKVCENGKEITETMEKESIEFADNLASKFDEDEKRLIDQMKDQKKFIEINTAFAEQLKNMREDYKEYINGV